MLRSGGLRHPLYSPHYPFQPIESFPPPFSPLLQVKGHEDGVRSALVASDTEGSGHLSGSQVEVALAAAGLKFTRHQIIALRRRVDRDRTGYVAPEEMLQLLGIGS